MRDLRVYASYLHGNVYHYRDSDGLDYDSVITLNDGRYSLVEIKLGGNSAIENASQSLNQLEEKIDTDNMNKPAFKMILTAVGEYAYKNADGIYIVPITLKP